MGETSSDTTPAFLGPWPPVLEAVSAALRMLTLRIMCQSASAYSVLECVHFSFCSEGGSLETSSRAKKSVPGPDGMGRVPQ